MAQQGTAQLWRYKAKHRDASAKPNNTERGKRYAEQRNGIASRRNPKAKKGRGIAP
jgi:hypothetical protein